MKLFNTLDDVLDEKLCFLHKMNSFSIEYQNRFVNSLKISFSFLTTGGTNCSSRSPQTVRTQSGFPGSDHTKSTATIPSFLSVGFGINDFIPGFWTLGRCFTKGLFQRTDSHNAEGVPDNVVDVDLRPNQMNTIFNEIPTIFHIFRHADGDAATSRR